MPRKRNQFSNKINMVLETLAKHKEQRPGEILISYISLNFFENHVVWDTARIGEKPCIDKTYNDAFIDKYPLFIMREEAAKKGWRVM